MHDLWIILKGRYSYQPPSILIIFIRTNAILNPTPSTDNILIYRLCVGVALIYLFLLPPLSFAAEPEGNLAEELIEEEPIPFASLPYAARMELNEVLLTIWESAKQEGNLTNARRTLLAYLRSPEGKHEIENGFLANSYLFHVLLARVGLLEPMMDRLSDGKNKGLHWFSHGLLRIYEKKSAQASSSFAKGIFSALQLGAADYKRLTDADIDVKYFPSMTSYSNAAFIAGRFYKMSYWEQQRILNIAIAEKVTTIEIIPADLVVPSSESYQLQALYYNLGAYLVLEEYNDTYAVKEFFNDPGDLYNILRERFGYDAREIFKRR